MSRNLHILRTSRREKSSRQRRMAGLWPGFPELRRLFVVCLWHLVWNSFFIHIIVLLFIYSWRWSLWSAHILFQWGLSRVAALIVNKTAQIPAPYQMETLENSSSLLSSKLGGLFWKIWQMCTLIIILMVICLIIFKCLSRGMTRQSKREIILS